MKHIIMSFIFVFCFVSLSFAQSSGALEDVTVKGDLALDIKSKKSQINLAYDVDINSVMKHTIVIDQRTLNAKPYELLELKTVLPSFIVSKRTIASYLNTIIEEPLVEFKFNMAGDPDVYAWELIISDATGDEFAIFDGGKKFPQSIVWSGRDYDDWMIIPGKWYSYVIKIYNSVGDIYTIPGETFSFPAIFYTEGYEKIISIATEELFGKNENNKKITKEKQLLLRETADYAKRYYPESVDVIVYDTNEDIAVKRAQVIAKYLAELLFLEEDEIFFTGEPAYITDTRVDIIIAE
ncbi:hypothetical protein ACFL4O_03350 [bacterium]